ncbi:hypothetical protein OE88DRAFT_1656405 [Heliocybe sulcata]|uniref:Uncharacterized protein n=1 Tax=Heliocybe sulcata TaxID=5364 RepID=A0A5C3N6G8_9AGAM|nr:hypothetical protein OE88DRAFT_1656405 [Heliocybe sulcata]
METTLQVQYYPDYQTSARPRTIRMAIEKPYTPFTMSQVLLVKNLDMSLEDLPAQFILKLFDRRFIERPIDCDWVPLIESTLQVIGAKINAGKRPDTADDFESGYISDWEPWKKEKYVVSLLKER